MKFASFKHICMSFDLKPDGRVEETIELLKEEISKRIPLGHEREVNTVSFSASELMMLLDLYTSSENRIFSDWVDADEELSAFLYGGISKVKSGSVKQYDGHTLQQRYKQFLTLFLSAAIRGAIDEAIKENNKRDIFKALKLSNLISNEERILLQHKVVDYLRRSFDGVRNDDHERKSLLSKETVQILNQLDDSYYAVRLEYIDWAREILGQESLGKIVPLLRRLNLSTAHSQELEQAIKKLEETKYSKRNVQLKSLLTTPLFYVGLLVLAVIIYLFLPKPTNKTVVPDGLLVNRSGLDSLNQSEIQRADTLLGYKNDTTSLHIEGINNQVNTVTNLQVVDVEDSLVNILATTLLKSMRVDYAIQNQQNDSRDCQPMTAAERTSFQMKGVKDISMLTSGYMHTISNESNDEVYILTFENRRTGEVYGAYIPSKGRINLRLSLGTHLVIYSGKDLTRFNPLMHKNGGYGSLEKAKKIDGRFTAHFCEFSIQNELLLNRCWVADRKGSHTTFQTHGGELSLKSDAFSKK